MVNKRVWNSNVSVIVCGAENGQITSTGVGSQTFENLVEAQKVFPDLDPSANTKRFTWAMGDPAKDIMRFETWEAEKVYGG